MRHVITILLRIQNAVERELLAKYDHCYNRITHAMSALGRKRLIPAGEKCKGFIGEIVFMLLLNFLSGLGFR